MYYKGAILLQKNNTDENNLYTHTDTDELAGTTI